MIFKNTINFVNLFTSCRFFSEIEL